MLMAFGLEPLEDRVVVKPLEDEVQKTPTGIIIPDTAKEKPQEGEVIAVGPGRFEEGQRIPVDVKVGDRVIYSKYGGTEVKVEGEDYLILSARDLFAIIKAGKGKK
jgi:chaperonin GroES